MRPSDIHARSRFILVMVLTGAVTIAAACDSASEPMPGASSAARSASANAPALPAGPGDPADWSIRAEQDLQPSTTRFTALVTRLYCNNGVTGDVQAPTIKTTATEIVVTFTVTAKTPGAAQCQGNNQVPYEVDLGKPLQDRSIIDGQCLRGREATKALCTRHKQP
jgi:hypothetical protein